MSAGMDALIAVRIISFGTLLLLPVTLAAMAILIPINYTDNYYTKDSRTSGSSDGYTTVFIRLTMSNITPGSPTMWVHFFFVYGVVFWACWLITEQYKEYITLRQNYVIRSTAMPNDALGGSTGPMPSESTPLIASRSPMKRKNILARAHFSRDKSNSLGDGTNGHSPNSAGGSGGGGDSGGGAVGKARRVVSRLRLPRRHASGSYNTSSIEASALESLRGEPMPSPGKQPSSMARPSRLSGAGPVLTSNPTFGSDIYIPPAPNLFSSNSPDNAFGSVSGGNQGSLQQQQHEQTSPQVVQWGAKGFVINTERNGGSGGGSGHGNVNANGGGGGGGGGSGGPDWTMHDFSVEIMHHSQSGPSTSTAADGAGLSTSASQPRSPMRGGIPAPPGNTTFLVSRPLPLLTNANGSQGSAQLRLAPNAAVATALDFSSSLNAAEALAKIRHHRALSGASAKSGTPGGGSTPRAGSNEVSNPGRQSFSTSLEAITDVRNSSSSPVTPSHPHRSTTSGGSGGGSGGGIRSAFEIASAGNTAITPAGRPKPPPGLSGIIAAVAAAADERSLDTDNGDLATAVALAPSLASPQGQSGVAHRWWNSLSTRE